jgi:citrate lyase gamma subunit
LYHSARLDRAVEGLIGELVGTLVLRTWDRLNLEGLELTSKLKDAVEKRLEARVTDLVPVFELANDEL